MCLVQIQFFPQNFQSEIGWIHGHGTWEYGPIMYLVRIWIDIYKISWDTNHRNTCSWSGVNFIKFSSWILKSSTMTSIYGSSFPPLHSLFRFYCFMEIFWRVPIQLQNATYFSWYTPLKGAHLFQDSLLVCLQLCLSHTWNLFAENHLCAYGTNSCLRVQLGFATCFTTS